MVTCCINTPRRDLHTMCLLLMTPSAMVTCCIMLMTQSWSIASFGCSMAGAINRLRLRSSMRFREWRHCIVGINETVPIEYSNASSRLLKCSRMLKDAFLNPNPKMAVLGVPYTVYMLLPWGHDNHKMVR